MTKLPLAPPIFLSLVVFLPLALTPLFLLSPPVFLPPPVILSPPVLLPLALAPPFLLLSQFFCLLRSSYLFGSFCFFLSLTSSGFPSSSNPLVASTGFPICLIPPSFFAISTAFATSFFAMFRLFSPFHPMPFSPGAHSITPISPFPIQIKCTSLLLEDDQAFHCPVSPLSTHKKQLRQQIKKANWEKLQSQPVVVTMEEANIWFLLSSCKCTQEIKLNIEWQMTVLSKKINIDFMDGITLLTALDWVKNSKLCNKH